MAKAPRTNESEATNTTGDIVEQKVVALAEQLGWFLGRVQAKADGWLDNDALRAQVGQIRDGAADLLEQVNRTATAARKTVVKTAAEMRGAKPATKPAAAQPKKKASRGPVDAPGKRHRKPPPQERLDKRMGEVQGKKAGQKAFKVGKSRGRG